MGLLPSQGLNAKKAETTETLAPSVTVLADGGKAARCPRLLVSRQCLCDCPVWLMPTSPSSILAIGSAGKLCLHGLLEDKRACSPNQVAETELEAFDSPA
jgi:hypothetical protein